MLNPLPILKTIEVIQDAVFRLSLSHPGPAQFTDDDRIRAFHQAIRVLSHRYDADYRAAHPEITKGKNNGPSIQNARGVV